MLRTQTQKQGSFHVCASCRRQRLQHLAQRRSSSRPRAYHLSATLRPFSATISTPVTLAASLRLRHGLTAPRCRATSIARTDTRRLGGWSNFTFGSPSLPGQSNSAWAGSASKNLPTTRTPSSASTLPDGGPAKPPAATGTSAWGGPTKLPPSTSPAPPWGGGQGILRGPGVSAWGGPTNAPLGPGGPAWGGPGSGLRGSGTPAWAPSGPTLTRPPGSGIPPGRSSAPTGLGAAPAWQPTTKPPPGPVAASVPGSDMPPVRPTSSAGLGSGTPQRPASVPGGSFHQPAVKQMSRLQMDENRTGSGVGATHMQGSAGAVSRDPVKNGDGAGGSTRETSPGNLNTPGKILQPQQTSRIASQPLATSAQPSGDALPGKPEKHTPTPIPPRAAQPQPGLARNSGSTPNTPPPPAALPSQFAFSPMYGPTPGAMRSTRPAPVASPGSSGAVSFGAMATASSSSNFPFMKGPPGAVSSAGAWGGKTPTFAVSPGTIPGSPTLAGPSGWASRTPVFGGAQPWTPGKPIPSASGSTMKPDLGNNVESARLRQRGDDTHNPSFASASPSAGLAASSASAAAQVSDHGQAKHKQLERFVWDRISVRSPVREPPAGAEFPKLLRKIPKRDVFESMSPFKLPPRRPEMPAIEPTAPDSQQFIAPEQDKRDDQLPRHDRYPAWTASSKPKGADAFEMAFSTASDGSSSDFSTPSKSQGGAKNITDKELSSHGGQSDDWDGALPRYQFRKSAAADSNSAPPDHRAGGRDADSHKDLEFRSRERDYRGRGRNLEPNEDSYAARDKANRRKKFGGDRKQNMVDDEEAYEEDDYREVRAKRQQSRKRQQEERAAEEAAAAAAVQKTIHLPEYITVYDLAGALRIKPAAFLRDLEQLGFEDTLVDSIMTGETAALVAAEYGFEPTVESGVDIDLRPRPPPEDLSSVPSRPPIVTIMGHVDHGKTTILDTLRKSSIVAQEFGGITQHIGAFSVKLSMGKTITFLDTPGHAAFLSMRQRGAIVTDMVVLVVAVDDSVKPQTIEAIRHAQNAKVPMIVAINKIDLDDTPNRLDLVKQDLASNDVDVEDFGGDVQAVGISGKTGRGIRDLEDAILTLSEVLDVRAETDGLVEGWVLEASIKQDGRAATVLVKRGTLRIGDLIVSGNAYTKVRILRNEAGVDVEEAGPGTPIEVYGSWKGEPLAGDMILQAPDETKAQAAVAYRQEIAERAIAAAQNADRERQEREQAERQAALKRKQQEADEDAAEAKTDEPVDLGPKVVSFIVKGDVMGSVEAVSAAIQEIGNNEVQSRILRSSPGQITESDVDHMATAKGAIVNFNNSIPGHILQRAEACGVVILDHNIIYETVQAVKDLLSAQLAPMYTQRVLAEALVQQVFPINITKRKYKNIAGVKVTNGKVTRGGQYRVLRNGEEIHKGKLSALKQKQSDVKEVGTGVECGLMLEDFDTFEEGDHIQLYEDVEQKRYL